MKKKPEPVPSRNQLRVLRDLLGYYEWQLRFLLEFARKFNAEVKL